jgi:hypothetical protein
MRKISTKLLVMVITTTAIIAAATTTQILQPAYSQATHCRIPERLPDATRCVTPGQDPSLTICVAIFCGPSRDITHQEAGRMIGENNQFCAKNPTLTCTVTPPFDTIP